MLDTTIIRSQFPSIAHHPDVLYFDNAATTQKPQSVLQAVAEYHHSYCANTHRSVHSWGMQSTIKIMSVRNQVAKFFNLESSEDIFFTSGATESSQNIALHFCKHFLQDGDEVITSQYEHKTLLLSWKNAIELTGKNIQIKTIHIDLDGRYDVQSLEKVLNKKTKVVILTHIHNIFGIEMGIQRIRSIIPASIPIILDAAQSVGHTMVDPKKLGIQGLYFSAHKMFGFSGVGAVWLDKKYQTATMPFEQGTVNIEGIISLGAAIEYISTIDIHQIESYLLHVTQYALQELRHIPIIEFLPGPAYSLNNIGHGILSFKTTHSRIHDVAQHLNAHQIFVRAGTHCTGSPLIEESIRISLQIYNTTEEIDTMCYILSTM